MNSTLKIAQNDKKPVKTGRPSAFPSPEDLPSKLSQALDLFRQGHSKTVIAIKIFGVTRETMAGWEKANPLFLEAIKRGEQESQAFWEQKAIEAVDNKAINAIPLIFNLKCRFPNNWRENNTLELPPGDITIQWRTGGQSAARAGKRR